MKRRDFVLTGAIARAVVSLSDIAIADQQLPHPSNGWKVLVDTLGHEVSHRIEIREDGTTEIERLEKLGVADRKKLYSGRESRDSCEAVFEATQSLFKNFQLKNFARPDVGRDDDLAYRITCQVGSRTAQVSFQSAEQRRDKALTHQMNVLFQSLNRIVPERHRLDELTLMPGIE
jgi:hypothetical protein